MKFILKIKKNSRIEYYLYLFTCIPVGGSLCNLLKSLMSLLRAAVDIFYMYLGTLLVDNTKTADIKVESNKICAHQMCHLLLMASQHGHITRNRNKLFYYSLFLLFILNFCFI